MSAANVFTPLDLALRVHDWRLSAHARQRVRERGVPVGLLLGVLSAPEVTYTHHAQTVLIRGPLNVIVDPVARVVVTLRLNAAGAWSNDAARAAFAGHAQAERVCSPVG